VLVISVWNDPPGEGMSVRGAIGTEVTAPPGADVNCTDSGLSPGLAGKATRSGTDALRCAGMVTGLAAGLVTQSCAPLGLNTWK
jgi:hypothetical protein